MLLQIKSANAWPLSLKNSENLGLVNRLDACPEAQLSRTFVASATTYRGG